MLESMCGADSSDSLDDILSFAKEKLEEEISQNSFILGGTVETLSQILKSCSSEQNGGGSDLFKASFEVIELLSNSSVPWEEIDKDSRTKSFRDFLFLIENNSQETKSSSDVEYFEGRNVIGELFHVTSNEAELFEGPIL